MPVRKGLEAGDKAEVFGELHENDRLVMTATEEIRDGSVVTVK